MSSWFLALFFYFQNIHTENSLEKQDRVHLNVSMQQMQLFCYYFAFSLNSIKILKICTLKLCNTCNIVTILSIKRYFNEAKSQKIIPVDRTARAYHEDIYFISRTYFPFNNKSFSMRQEKYFIGKSVGRRKWFLAKINSILHWTTYDNSMYLLLLCMFCEKCIYSNTFILPLHPML